MLVLWLLFQTQATVPIQSGETIVRAPRSELPLTTSQANVTVIEGEELVKTGERSLPRALAAAGAVWVQETNLGGGSPILHGQIGNQVLIVIDGVRLNDASTRTGPNQSLNGIDPAAVERIEVIRGPTSVLYGSDAIGGAILVWTKNRRPSGAGGDRAWHSEVGASYASVADGGRGDLGFSGADESNGWLGVIGGQIWDDLDTGGDGITPNTGYSGHSAFGSWQHALASERSLRLAWSMTKDYDIPRTDRMNVGFGQQTPANDEYFFTEQNRQRSVLTFDDREPGAFADAVQARLSFRYYEEDRVQRSFGSTTRRFENDAVETLGLGVDWKKALGDHLLTWGLDVDRDEIFSARRDLDLTTGTSVSTTGTFAPESEYLSSGVFLQDEIFAFDAFDLTAGARFSYLSFDFLDPATSADAHGDFSALTGSIAASREIAPGVRVIGTVAQGFRAPNLSELARDSTFAAGTELHNADLEPEESLLGQLAFEVERPTWSFAVSAWHDNISDVVGRRLVDPGGAPLGDETYVRENTGTNELVGVDGLVRVRLGPESPWSVRAAFEWIEGKQYDDFFDSTTNSQPFYDVDAPRIPPLHGEVALRFEPAAEGRLDYAELSLIAAAEQDQLAPQDLADPRFDPSGTDGWTTLNLDFGGPVGARLSGATWSLGLHNLLDEEYRVHGSGFDGPGFGVVVGLRSSR